MVHKNQIPTKIINLLVYLQKFREIEILQFLLKQKQSGKSKMDFNVQQSIEGSGIRYRETRRSILFMNCLTTLTKREMGEDWIITIALVNSFSNMETEEQKLIFQQTWDQFVEQVPGDTIFSKFK